MCWPIASKINGIKAIKAAPGETSAALASRAGVTLSDFLTWNDISKDTRIEPDQYYLLGKKRTRAQEAYHKVSAGESLWDVSQRYGVQIKKLRRYNRLSSSEEVKPGTTIWLASKKPKDFEEESNSNQVIEVDNASTFAWTAESARCRRLWIQSQRTPPVDNNAVVAGLLVEKEMPIVKNTAEKDLDSTAKYTTW